MASMYEIYDHHADRYDRLVTAEDYRGNLDATLREILAWHDAVVYEAGVGTGRVTRLYADAVRHATLCDRSAHMLDRARRNLRPWLHKLTFMEGDNLALPPGPDGPADIVIEGWSFGHAIMDEAASVSASASATASTTTTTPTTTTTTSTTTTPTTTSTTSRDSRNAGSHGTLGEREADAVRRVTAELLAAAAGVARPGATLIILETMGTAVDHPHPPAPPLAAFYRTLETTYTMHRKVISTDYRFASPRRAQEVMGFFFGPDMAERVGRLDDSVVPEWTGVWWGTVGDD